MDIEYEATFPKVNKDEVRKILKKLKAKLIKKEFLQKRRVFHLPKGHKIKGGWLRVRDEGGKITLSLKVVDGSKIENQKEIYLEVSSFEQGVLLLETLGCVKKAYQENLREIWEYKQVVITIDEWPFLEPFVEVEGKSEEIVKEVSGDLGFDYSKAVFGAVGILYGKKYGLSQKRINDNTPVITFDKNPFV